MKIFTTPESGSFVSVVGFAVLIIKITINIQNSGTINVNAILRDFSELSHLKHFPPFFAHPFIHITQWSHMTYIAKIVAGICNTIFYTRIAYSTFLYVERRIIMTPITPSCYNIFYFCIYFAYHVEITFSTNRFFIQNTDR